MRHCILGPIDQLKEHRIRDMQPCKLVESAGRHDYFSAVIHVLALWARKHDDGVATVIFIEAARGATRAWATHAGEAHGHGVVVWVVAWVELDGG